MRQLKSSLCLIWILIGFVVLAVVDQVPDPPSAKPDSAWSSVSSPHELPVVFGIASEFQILAFGQSQHSVALMPSEPVLPASRTERLERATDPSPPALRS